MSDAEDHLESDADKKAIEENKAIEFEWTPELITIGTSCGEIHPSIGPIELRDGWPIFIYQPDMALPDPANTLECLKWVGLSDQKILEANESFNLLYPDYQKPASGYDEEHTRTGRNNITFPLLDKLVDTFIKGLPRQPDAFEYTHESYIKRGIQRGLRPEFAIFCGLHKDDSRAIEDPELFEEDWFTKGPEDIIVDFIISFWMQLKGFMAAKLVHESKAWADAHGKWLVHEGETLDQAKARVNDQERQRLREKATEEYERLMERRRQEDERYRAKQDSDN